MRSGLRYDYLLLEKNDRFLEQLCRDHISGQLKVAPEHSSPTVLAAMGKPEWKVYQKFANRYQKINQRLGKKQYLVPYLIAAHPGSRLKDALELAIAMKKGGWQPEQVQLFIPTPGSRSTAMYYSGYDPRTMEPIYVARTERERQMQRALLQFADPKNWPLVRKALLDLGRSDLIGRGKDCLVPAGDVPGYGIQGKHDKKMDRSGFKAGAAITFADGRKEKSAENTSAQKGKGLKRGKETPLQSGKKATSSNTGSEKISRKKASNEQALKEKGSKNKAVKQETVEKAVKRKAVKGETVMVGSKYRSTGEQKSTWYEQKGFRPRRK